MKIRFWKYQGTGNDFVMLDGRSDNFSALNQSVIERLCHRRFGIGADGLIILRPHPTVDFEMEYYNSDGLTSSMCGNGGRCIVRFASDLGIHKDLYRFEAIDGSHEAVLEGGLVRLKMKDVSLPGKVSGDYFLDTGSPHHVRFVTEMPGDEFVTEARSIRNQEGYRDKGVNVNFVTKENGALHMRTYERGVEDETYSCGTGVTAAALVAHSAGLMDASEISIKTAGGDLSVSFQRKSNGYADIWLRGPAKKVFEGEVEL